MQITTTLLTMIIMIGVYEVTKWIVKSIRYKIQERRTSAKFHKERASIAYHHYQKLVKRMDALDGMNDRLNSVEKIADNFDRDMNRFNCDIMRDINNRFTEKDKVVDKNQKGLANAFKWIAKLEGNQHDLNSDFVKELAEFSVRIDNMRRSLNDFIGVRQYNAAVVDRIGQLEERQKEYDTNLHTQAVMIGDLQGKANSKGIL